MYVGFPLSLRNFEDLLFESGIDVCHQSVRFWNKFGAMFAADIRRQRVSRTRGFRQRFACHGGHFFCVPPWTSTLHSGSRMMTQIGLLHANGRAVAHGSASTDFRRARRRVCEGRTLQAIGCATCSVLSQSNLRRSLRGTMSGAAASCAQSGCQAKQDSM
jgi:hypothetical protein